ncbi:MAG: outer membrane beta-barrel protein [Candidatus Omnitrophica bacterium]|nr:outer membrane beta-barrel protein [Candidatus Omnitrophota bacterium]
MKKIILLSLITLLCLPLAVYAASIGGAETQGKGKLAIGLDQEFVFDRDMKDTGATVEGGEDVTIAGTAKTEIDNMYRTMVKASYGLFENLDIYVKLGTADFKATSKQSGTWDDGEDTGTWNASEEFNSNNALAYGFGMKGTYSLENDWIIGCEAQYLRHKHDKMKMAGSMNVYDDVGDLIADESGTDSWEADTTIQEWQVAPYIAKKIGDFIPYLGVKYSDLRANYKDEDGKLKLKADDNFGVFVGTDYKIGENWKLNLEGRFVDETAMSVGATYKF